MDAQAFYNEFFDPDNGGVYCTRVAELMNGTNGAILKVTEELYQDVFHGDLKLWGKAGLPDLHLPYRELSDWEFSALSQGRMIGMKDTKLLVAAQVSPPLLGAWIRYGQDVIRDPALSGYDNLYGELAKLWPSAHFRSQIDAMARIQKKNPELYIRQTDKDGEFDDKFAYRMLEHKQKLQNEAETQPLLITFDYTEDE